MLTNNIIGLQFRFVVLKCMDRLFRTLPIGKQWKSMNSLKTQFRLKSIESLFRRQIIIDNFGIHADGILFNTLNGFIISHPQDVEINNKLGFQGQYDWSNLENIRSFLGPSTNLYVFGAHVGCLLIPLSSSVNKIIAFEANPETFQHLRKNIALNNIENAEIYNLAVYNTDTRIKFYQSKANTGGSKIKPVSDRFIYNYDSPAEIEVDAISIDNFIQINNLPQPDFIIMDIEGAEFFALQGAAQSLKDCKYLYVEFVPHHLFNVSKVNVRNFSSVIMPFFSKMYIVNGGDKIYQEEEILRKLDELYINNRIVDLMFLK